MPTSSSAVSNPESVKDSINKGDPNNFADLMRRISIGDVLLGQAIQTRRQVDMTAAAQANEGYNVATLSAIAMKTGQLPPAASILRATVRAGGVTGELAPQAFGATPATTQIAVAPNGAIVTLTADAITNLDIVYVPERGLVVDYTGPVVAATAVMALPASIIGNGIVLLLEAEVLTGSVTGKKIVLVPGAVAPATLSARLSVAKIAVNFNLATDVPTRARVKLFVAMPVGEGLIGTMAQASVYP